MRVQEIMTPDPVCARVDHTRQQALELLDARGVRHLPVVGQDGRLMGVLSDRDLMEACGCTPEGLSAGPGERSGPVGKLVRRAPVTIGPRDTAVLAALEMQIAGIGCLPVVDAGRVCGIVTQLDLLAAFCTLCLRQDLPQELDGAARERMASNALSVQAATSFSEALALGRASGARHLPVVRDGRLVGVLADRDLRRAIEQRRAGATPVEALMGPVTAACTQETRLSACARQLLEHGLSSLPVVEGERLVGILWLPDLLQHCIEALRSLEAAGMLREPGNGLSLP